MSESAEISGNMANGVAGKGSAESGGGVYLGAGMITLSGNARIVNNTAKYNGGGICADYDNNGIKIIMNGGEISGNKAVKAGGIYLRGGGSVTMNGGTITGNEAEYGAGVYAGKNSTVTHKGGIITGNEAEFVGGGVYVESGATYTAGGGRVTGNTAGDGGMIYSGSSKPAAVLALFLAAFAPLCAQNAGRANFGAYPADYRIAYLNKVGLNPTVRDLYGPGAAFATKSGGVPCTVTLESSAGTAAEFTAQILMTMITDGKRTPFMRLLVRFEADRMAQMSYVRYLKVVTW
jgi:predicted outer membrane repeat protein